MTRSTLLLGSIPETFGKVLKRMREDKNLSQEELSVKAQLDRSYISMLERSRRQPSLTTLFQIALALDTFPSRLVAIVETEEKYQELVTKFKEFG